MYEYTFFDTALGRCAIAWGPQGIAAVELPGRTEAALQRRIQRLLPGAREAGPPQAVRDTIGAIVALLAGEPDDELAHVALDMERVPEFNRRVYEATRRIPAGSTLSCGEVAERIGERGSAQAVGQALGSNPFPVIVPCHRVVAADGSLRGFSAPGGIETKRRMLAIEGAGAPTLFD
jgi:methylated-DNA-[protein]-cysteine S-methyltransferase